MKRGRIFAYLSALTLVVVSTIVAIVAIFAASMQNVSTSNMLISFNSTDVYATITGSFTIGDTTTNLLTNPEDEHSTAMVFDYNTQSSPQDALHFYFPNDEEFEDGINLDGTNGVIYFTYAIRNDSESDAISVTNGYTETNNSNFIISYYYLTSNARNTIASQDFTNFSWLNNAEPRAIPAGGSLFIYLKFAPETPANSGTISGGFNVGLTNVDAADVYQMNFVEITDGDPITTDSTSLSDPENFSNADLFGVRYYAKDTVLTSMTAPKSSSTSSEYVWYTSESINPNNKLSETNSLTISSSTNTLYAGIKPVEVTYTGTGNNIVVEISGTGVLNSNWRTNQLVAALVFEEYNGLNLAQNISASNVSVADTDITSITISGNITAPVNSTGLFSGLSNLTTFTISGFFDTSSVTNMQSMFFGCSSLTSLDLSGFDTSAVTDMMSMFGNCSSLTTIEVSNLFVVTAVTSSDDMFVSCTNLVGGDGTTYSTSFKDKTYARVDDISNSAPGYFTLKVTE